MTMLLGPGSLQVNLLDRPYLQEPLGGTSIGSSLQSSGDHVPLLRNYIHRIQLL
jgi:hypothetical protein